MSKSSISKESMKRISELVKKLVDCTIGVVLILSCLICACAIANVVAPIFTSILVLVFTFMTFERKLTGFSALTGIILYALSWPALSAYGIWTSSTLCCFGFSIWAISVWTTIMSNLKQRGFLVA